MKKTTEYFFSTNIGDLYRGAQSQIGEHFSEEDVFSLELLELEIFGMISFLVKAKVPDDAEFRALKIRSGSGLMISLLGRDDISTSLRKYLTFVELARVWVLDELERVAST